MSYSIYIGEATILRPTSQDDIQLEATVEHVELPDAPTFPGDEMTGIGNGRHPGYGQWTEFTQQTGLEELFFEADTGIMSAHPGVFALKIGHLRAVEVAERKWCKAHAGKIAGWDPATVRDPRVKADPRYDGNAARLIWLRWWMKWALTNCKIPAISNS